LKKPSQNCSYQYTHSFSQKTLKDIWKPNTYQIWFLWANLWNLHIKLM
jgi:hypothetical protein